MEAFEMNVIWYVLHTSIWYDMHTTHMLVLYMHPIIVHV